MERANVSDGHMIELMLSHKTGSRISTRNPILGQSEDTRLADESTRYMRAQRRVSAILARSGAWAKLTRNIPYLLLQLSIFAILVTECDYDYCIGGTYNGTDHRDSVCPVAEGRLTSL